MKERIIKVLQITRKFGFIMAAVMVFPYVSSFPAVMASDGETTVETHEVSMEELEQEYAVSNSSLKKDILIYNEIKPYVVLNDQGLFEVNIPNDIVLSISPEEVEDALDNIEMINKLIEAGEATAYEDFSVYLNSLDSDFQIQAATNSFYIKYWKMNISLGQVEGVALSIGLYILNQASNYYALYRGGPSAIATQFVKNTSATSLGISATFLSINPLGLAGEADVATYMYGLCVTAMAGHAIYTALASAVPGVGTIVSIVIKALVAIGMNYVWNQIGGTMFLYSASAVLNKDINNNYRYNSRLSGFKLRCSLTLRKQEWSYQY